MTRRSLFFGLVCLLTCLRAFTQGTFVYDQQSTVFLEGAVEIIDSNQPVGQSFTPSLSAVNFIMLILVDASPFSPAGASAYVNLRANSISGPILGISDVVTMANNTGDVRTFLFPSAIPLTPGTMYYFQPIVLAGGDRWISAVSQGYAGGTAFVHGVPATDGHFWFQEGIIVPEPSSLVLLLFGAGVVARFANRKRSYL